MSVPNAQRTARALRAGFAPLWLALVETIGMPASRHSVAAIGWWVMRTAVVGRPPVIHSGVMGPDRITHVMPLAV